MPAARTVAGDLGRFAADLAVSMRRLAARGLPEVLAIELAARILGTLLVAVAGSVGATSAVGGLALTAVTALVRMVAMILQILVLLRAMRSTPPPLEGSARLQSALAGLAASVLPAFLLLTAWGLFTDDLREYALTALSAIDWFQEGAGVGAVLDVPVDVLSIGLLVGCLVLRGVLRRFERRGTRRGVSVATLVLEGLWTFLAVSILARLLGMAGDWFATTRLASGVDDVRAAIDGVIGGWLLQTWEAVGEVWHTVSLPLVWLTLVGIVLLGARPELAPEPAEPPRPARWWLRLLEALPSPLDDLLEELTDDLHDRWVPIVATLRQVWGAGLVPLGAAVLAWHVVHVAASWLTVALTHALGGQPQQLAEAVANVGGALGDSIVAVLGLVVSVAALDALRLRAVPEAAGQSVSGTPSQIGSPPTSSLASDTEPAGTTNPTTPDSEPSSA
ncbi:hypothetical protein [Agrococcus jejuensis]|uniref:Uncharacterized protein n=1 Tax=Agrococcus jejuensis TaxID=399736 RepID=A0A1G8AQI5_9MICO|nr:hypothetical protein [Agrococcus jejuensis]SDH22986.1 hypothetical protein SAMN04489720_0481 [Agrococcus jejuensis]